MTKYTGVVNRRVARPGKKGRARSRPRLVGGGACWADDVRPRAPRQLAAPMPGLGSRPGGAGRGEVRHGRRGQSYERFV